MYDFIHWEEGIQADPSIFKRAMIAGYKDTGTKLSQMFADEGIWMVPATNDKISGIAKFNSYIVGRPGVEPLFGVETELNPMLYVSDKCDWWHNEVINYFWKKNPQGTFIDEPMDKDDHAMDMTKYLLAKLPEPSKIVVPGHARPKEYMKWHELDANARMR